MPPNGNYSAGANQNVNNPTNKINQAKNRLNKLRKERLQMNQTKARELEWANDIIWKLEEKLRKLQRSGKQIAENGMQELSNTSNLMNKYLSGEIKNFAVLLYLNGRLANKNGFHKFVNTKTNNQTLRQQYKLKYNKILELERKKPTNFESTRKKTKRLPRTFGFF